MTQFSQNSESHPIIDTNFNDADRVSRSSRWRVDGKNTDGVKQLVILRSSEGLWVTAILLLTHSKGLYGVWTTR